MDWLVYIFYGFITGLGELLPVSAGAHDYFLELMTRFNPQQPLLRLCIHAAALGALVLFNRYRVAHIYREMHIASQPARRRRRQPDLVAVLDGRVVLTALIPAAIGLLLTSFMRKQGLSLPLVVLLLMVSGAVIYAPHFLPGANRDSRHLSRIEAVIFGICAGLSAFPGVSRMGGVLSSGALGGCSRSFMLDVAYLLLIPLLAMMVVLDVFGILAAGVAAITLVYLIQCLLAGAAAFGGACLAIAAMRFLSVNMGYTAFAYYNWGLGIFGFILYLMI